MESIDILTGQHVTIKYEPAFLIARIGALLLDYFILFSYLILLFHTFKYALAISSRSTANILMVIFLLPAMTYHFIFESLLGGRTLGKMIFRIRVTNIDGSVPGIGAYFLRWILLPVDMFPSGGIGVLFIAFSSFHQRLGDMAAGTVVVKANPSLAMDLNESYYEFSDDYEPTFKEVSRLTDGQIMFIVNLLTAPKNRGAVLESMNSLANKIKKNLGIDSLMTDRLFLETIVRDYNYYATLGI